VLILNHGGEQCDDDDASLFSVRSLECLAHVLLDILRPLQIKV
jgi:hypothetical protein